LTKIAKNLSKKIQTKLIELKKFYPAEDYHQNYYKNNSEAGYCQLVINPKLSKFRQQFKDLME